MIDLLEQSRTNRKGYSLEVTGYMDLHLVDYSVDDDLTVDKTIC